MRLLNLSRQTTVAESVETADTLWRRFLGLMGRSRFEPDTALWLPEANGIHMMFMRFPIDAVFLGRPDADGARAVVGLHRDLRTWTGLVPYVKGAHGVLELPVGSIQASGTQIGDLIEIA